MKDSSAANIRQAFLDYFASHGHTKVKSGPLVPAGDATLMFTNAGMVPFKDVFVGAEVRPYKRATSVQKCMRVSGKHNDLEEVGRTARHHTLFEMLGNFSFGDYFKEEAIHYAWTLLTGELQLNPDKLWITVFGGAEGIAADTEARALWRKISGLPNHRILDMGMKDNFWSMGDVGPCGPCSEIHYDQGQGPVGQADFESGRVMEIWNNVFMQFNRQANGDYVPLPAPSVDTGMGLERVVALMQGQSSNYHSDLFLPLLETVAEIAGKPYQRSDSEDDVSMRVIADHARATAFLVADGIQPANEGRGYVMRRIMRRAIRHGRRLGIEKLFMGDVTQKVTEMMGEAYPEVIEVQSLLAKVTELEEVGFRRTLDTGLKILGDALQDAKKQPKPALGGEVIFRLYDTYGFPKDLTEVIAQEAGVGLDEAGFAASMQAQKVRSRGATNKESGGQETYKALLRRLGPTAFIGYPHEDEPLQARPGVWRLSPDNGTFLEAQVQIAALLVDGIEVDHATAAGDGIAVEVVLAPTPFYGESGGQIGDTGRLCLATGPDQTLQASVVDTQKPLSDLTVQHVHLTVGSLRVGQTVWAGYPPALRRDTRRHHSATHLLHGALRAVLGEHVKQAGSRVGTDTLRFDFSHFSALTPQQLQAVEADANQRIADNAPVQVAELSYDEAKTSGAIALFGEKYGDRVRVLTMGASVELCGGTHARNTGELGLLLIGREEAVQSGVRRIEARVGTAAQAAVNGMRSRLLEVGAALADRYDVKPGAEVDPVVATVVRLRGQYDAALAALGGNDAAAIFAPKSAEATGASDTVPSGTWRLAEAQAVRGLWQRVGQLVQARATEVAGLMATWQDGKLADPLLADIASLLEATRHNERRLQGMASQSLAGTAKELVAQAETVGGIALVCAQVDVQGEALRSLADSLRAELGSGIVCLGAAHGDRVTLLITVTADLTSRLMAGKLVRTLAPYIDGRGGGKAEFAQAGGTRPAGLPEAFAQLKAHIAAL
jgi:alanyl-tRNA synthetase